MSRRVKMIAKPHKKSMKKAAFGIIKQIPNGDEMYHQIVNELYPNFNDKYQLYKYNSIEEVPVLKSLIDIMKNDIKAPADISPAVQVGIYTRDSGTFIQPPEKNCALRILVNLGYADTYNFLPEYRITKIKETPTETVKSVEVINSGLDECELFLNANSYAVLGPVKQCEYLIKVNNDPMVAFPGRLPTDPVVTKVRARDYKRITVVFDYLASVEMLEKMTEVLKTANIPKLKVNASMGPKAIEEQMKKLQASVAQNSVLKQQVETVLATGGIINNEPVGSTSDDISDFEKEVLAAMEAEKKIKAIEEREGALDNQIISNNPIMETDKDILAEMESLQ